MRGLSLPPWGWAVIAGLTAVLALMARLIVGAPPERARRAAAPGRAGTAAAGRGPPGPAGPPQPREVAVSLSGRQMLLHVHPGVDDTELQVGRRVAVNDQMLVVASQVPHVASRPDVVARVVPLFVAFALVMPAVGDVAGRMAHQGRQERLALAFSGTTRNSLVVLPLALALPDSMGMAPIVVVTQTLVELVVMAIGVRLLPRLIR